MPPSSSSSTALSDHEGASSHPTLSSVSRRRDFLPQRSRTNYANDNQQYERSDKRRENSNSNVDIGTSTTTTAPEVLSRTLSEKISSSSLSSGQSTPLPSDAPPSVQTLHTTRKDRRSNARRKIFYSIDYKNRASTLDPSSGPHDFHGFFVLFWIALSMMVTTTLAKNYIETGHLLRVSMWGILYANFWQLGRVDALMVLSTGMGLLIHRAIRWGGARGKDSVWAALLAWDRGGVWVQGTYELVWLVFWANAPLYLEWTWTANVFFILHTICLLMKMHSYTFYNGHLSACELEIKALDKMADEKEKLDLEKYKGHTHRPGSNPNYCPGQDPTLSPEDEAAARKQGGQHDVIETPSGDANNGNSNSNSADESDEQTTTVQARRNALAYELTSTLGHVTYPANLTWTDYVLFLCSPTLCYELEYPRVKEIRYWKIAVDALAVFGCIFLMILVSGEFIVPVLQASNIKIAASRTRVERALVVAETVNGLLTPFLIEVLLTFLVIFEYICGASAEVTRFADRRFYEDWWNSCDWLEFSRKWNIPVHHFLRRHVYFPALTRMSSSGSLAYTFLISSLFHELVMACMSKKIRGYGFFMQMTQVPLIAIQKSKWVKKNKGANNAFFWISIILGTSLICALYVLL